MATGSVHGDLFTRPHSVSRREPEHDVLVRKNATDNVHKSLISSSEPVHRNGRRSDLRSCLRPYTVCRAGKSGHQCHRRGSAARWPTRVDMGWNRVAKLFVTRIRSADPPVDLRLCASPGGRFSHRIGTHRRGDEPSLWCRPSLPSPSVLGIHPVQGPEMVCPRPDLGGDLRCRHRIFAGRIRQSLCNTRYRASRMFPVNSRRHSVAQEAMRSIYDRRRSALT
jgi:hypothetical protein